MSKAVSSGTFGQSCTSDVDAVALRRLSVVKYLARCYTHTFCKTRWPVKCRRRRCWPSSSWSPLGTPVILLHRCYSPLCALSRDSQRSALAFANSSERSPRAWHLARRTDRVYLERREGAKRDSLIESSRWITWSPAWENARTDGVIRCRVNVNR